MNHERNDEARTAECSWASVPCTIGPEATVIPVRGTAVIRVDGGASTALAAALPALQTELEFVLRNGHFVSLTDAARALCRYAVAPPTADEPNPRPTDATIRLTDERAGTDVIARAHRDHETYGRESKPFGRVDVIHENPFCGIYRLRIRAGGSIATHVHATMDERELVLGSGLQVQRDPVPRGTEFHWPHGFAHRYDNPTDIEQTVLCIDRPRFDPVDEREVPDPPGGLRPLGR